MVTRDRHTSRIPLLFTAVTAAILLAFGFSAAATAAPNAKITVRSLTVVKQNATRATINVRGVAATTKCDVKVSNRKGRAVAGTNGFEIRVQLRKARKTTTQRGTITCKPQGGKPIKKSFRIRVRGAKTGRTNSIIKVTTKRTDKTTAGTKTPPSDKSYDPTDPSPPKHFTMEQKVAHGQQYFRYVIDTQMKHIRAGDPGDALIVVYARNLGRVDQIVESVVRKGYTASNVNFVSPAHGGRVLRESGLPVGRPYEVGQWLFEPNSTAGRGMPWVFGEIVGVSEDGMSLTVFGECNDQGIRTGCEQNMFIPALEARGATTLG